MLTRQNAARRALTAVLATALVGAPIGLVPIGLATSVAQAAPADEAPPNERAPRVPDAPDLGDTPWTSEAGRDMRGYRMSTYTGKYYDRSREQYRLCVIQRESGGQYDEPSGPWRGAYQFNDGLAASALRAIREEIVGSYGAAGKRALDALEGTYINTWPRFFQDAAFWTTFNKGAGAGHWAGGTWYCNPARNAESGWPNPNRWNYSPLERDKARSATARPAAVKLPRIGTPEGNQRLARTLIRDRHDWGYDQFRALKSMWWRESNWQHTVINRAGPWYGLGQVNGDFIASRGYSVKRYMSSPRVQIKVGASYIKQRYGSPVKAWSFWQANGWY